MGTELWGGALLLSCAFLGGVLRANALARQQALAKGFLALLHHIRVQISSYAKPLDAIFASVDQGLLAACGAQARVCNLTDLLAQVGDRLAPDVRDLLTEFARALGTSLRTEQLRLCEGAITQLEALLAAAKTEVPRRRRLWLLLPPIAAGALWLLLL